MQTLPVRFTDSNDDDDDDNDEADDDDDVGDDELYLRLNDDDIDDAIQSAKPPTPGKSRLNPRVVKRLREIVAFGITNAVEIRKILRLAERGTLRV